MPLWIIGTGGGSGSGITNIIEDTSPTLGGNLSTAGHNIIFNSGSVSDFNASTMGSSATEFSSDGAIRAVVAMKANVLELNNTTAFTPDADYEPATKKYVDDKEVVCDEVFITGLATALSPLTLITTEQFVAVPASSSATGTKGQVAYNGNYYYVCVATDTWIQIAVASSF